MSICFLSINKIITKKNRLEETKCRNYDKVIYQPNIINYGNQLGDYLITNKLIKRSLFLKAYRKFKKKIYQGKWNYGEDEVWSILVNKYANSMICIKKVIFIYYTNSDSLMNNRFNSLYFLNLINWLEMFIKILNDKMSQIYLKRPILLLENLIRKKKFLKQIKNNTETKEQYIKIFQKVLKNYHFLNISLNNTIYLLK